MERLDSSEKSLLDEVARLGQELEQARTALEDAHAEVAALVEERNGLQRAVVALDRARQDAELAARRHSAATAALVTDRLRQTDTNADMKTALEEASVLAEELQVANEELQTVNAALDERVELRTAELARANTELEQVNVDLQIRVDSETAARVKAQAELFQMQKMEAIGQLTGGIAHDFNNLLMVIINGLQVIAQSGDTDLRERALRRTQEASWRASELTRRLLAFARRQALHPERVDLPEQAENLRELLGQGLRENIELRTNIAAEVWPLEVDLGALELALLNLTVNARDAMPDGGTLTIEARNATIVVGSPAGRGLAPGDYVELGVADTGIGMAPDVLEKVFEPFFTTKGSGRGTGLGLAQVYGFAQQSGGTAWVESGIGAGTIVRLLLRRSLREAAQRPVPSCQVLETAPRSNLRVLVVEDEPTVAAVVLDMLAQLGHRGTCVETVATALALLSHTGETDLVLSDVLLPGGESGVDLAREVRNRKLEVPVILTSGYGGTMTQRLSTMNLPFLHKPYRIEMLQQAIDAAMQPSAPPRRLSAMAGRG